MESGIRNPETEAETQSRKRKRNHGNGNGNGTLTAKDEKKNKTTAVYKYPASLVASIFPNLGSRKIEGDSVRRVVYGLQHPK